MLGLPTITGVSRGRTIEDLMNDMYKAEKEIFGKAERMSFTKGYELFGSEDGQGEVSKDEMLKVLQRFDQGRLLK
jgi:hypothetical protein